MKKLETLKNTTFKGNTIAENKLRNICGGYYYQTWVGAGKGDIVVDGSTHWYTTITVTNDSGSK
jgi:hypothetical protein